MESAKNVNLYSIMPLTTENLFSIILLINSIDAVTVSRPAVLRKNKKSFQNCYGVEIIKSQNLSDFAETLFSMVKKILKYIIIADNTFQSSLNARISLIILIVLSVKFQICANLLQQKVSWILLIRTR